MDYGDTDARGHVSLRYLQQPGKIVIETPLAAPSSLIAIGPNAAAALRPSPVVSTRVIAIGENALALAAATSQRNIGIGRAALGSVVGTATDNVAIGDGALAVAASVGPSVPSFNVAVGNGALAALTTGNNNAVLGYNAAPAGNPSQVVAIGSNVLELSPVNTIGGVYIGADAARSAAAGTEFNVVIGYQALRANTAATIHAVVIGHQAMSNGVGANDANVAIGYRAALGLTTGGENTIVGTAAAPVLTIGARNTILGRNSATGLISGSDNILHGYLAGTSLVSGDGNVLIGRGGGGGGGDVPAAGSSNYIAISAFVFGGALPTLVVADPALHNVHIGSLKPGNWLTATGADNHAVGHRALDALTSGARNLAYGTDALGVLTTGADNVAVGHNALLGVAGSEAAVRNVVIGAFALDAISAAAPDNVVIGYNAATGVTNLQTSVVIGANAFDAATSSTAVRAVVIGFNAVGNAATAAPIDDVVVGYQAAIALTTAVGATVIGSGAGAALTSGDGNILLGFGAAPALTTGNTNIVIGSFVAGTSTSANLPASGSTGYIVMSASANAAGNNLVVSDPALHNLHIGPRKPGNWLTATGADNHAFGDRAMDALTSGARNLAYGTDALGALLDGTDNIAIGSSASGSSTGGAITSGARNVAIGTFSLGTITTGTNNTVVGYDAFSLATTSAARNVVIGSTAANALNVNTTDLVAIGDNAAGNATSLADSVVIGSSAFLGATATAARAVVIGTAAAGSAGTAAPIDAVYAGYRAAFVSTTAQKGVVIGSLAGAGLTTGLSNTLIGYNAAPALTTGGGNVVIGTLEAGGGANVPAAASAQYLVISAHLAGGAAPTIAVADPTLRNLHFGARRPGNWLTASGADNQSFGDRTLDALTSGARNIAHGSDSLGTLTTGTDNLAYGHNAMLGAAGSEAALRNIAIGSFALDAINAAVTDVVAVGYNAATAVTSAVGGVYIGRGAGTAATTGPYNVLIGFNVAPTLVAGDHNIVIGAVEDTSTLADVSASGATGQIVLAAEETLEGPVFRQSLVVVAHSGVFIGSNKPGNWKTATGQENVAVGHTALGVLTIGTANTALGANALDHLTTGDFNIGIGKDAGNVLTTGARNIVIGNDADTPANNSDDVLNVGKAIFGNLSTGNVRIGGLQTVAVGAQTERLAVTSTSADTTAPFSIETTGASGAKILHFAGTQYPNGTISGNPGDLYARKSGTSSRLNVNIGAAAANTNWFELGGGGVDGLRVLRPVYLVPDNELTVTAQTAYAVYLGYLSADKVIKFVECALPFGGTGAQTAEVALASSPLAPNKAGQTLTFLVSSGTLDDLTTTGVKRNTTAFNAGAGFTVPGGTHLWAVFRSNMATLQPHMWGLRQTWEHGYALTAALVGALTGLGPTAFSLAGEFGNQDSTVCPALAATMD